jgi:hypothetical protein
VFGPLIASLTHMGYNESNLKAASVCVQRHDE